MVRVLLRNIYDTFKSALRGPCSHHEHSSLCPAVSPGGEGRAVPEPAAELGGLWRWGWDRGEVLGTAGDGEVSTLMFSPAHPQVCHKDGSLCGPAVGLLHGKSWEPRAQNFLAAAPPARMLQAPRAGQLLASRVRDRGSEEGACCQQPLWTQDVSLITSRWIHRNHSHLRRKKKIKKHVSCRINEIRMVEAGQPGGEARCQDHGYV